MIPLYLISHGILDKPALYLSDFFERYRDSYYDALMRVRVSNDLNHWIRFFLNGVIDTAGRGKAVFQSVLALRSRVERTVVTLGRRAESAHAALSVLYRQPILTAAELAAGMQVSVPTAHKMVDTLVTLNILKKASVSASRAQLYVFEEYFNLFVNESHS